MRETPDPENSQGQEEDDSSETWTSWLNTCSPIQHTLLTACMVEMYKEIKVKPLALMMSLQLIFIISFPVRMGFGTYIGEVVGSLRKGGTIS